MKYKITPALKINLTIPSYIFNYDVGIYYVLHSTISTVQFMTRTTAHKKSITVNLVYIQSEQTTICT